MGLFNWSPKPEMNGTADPLLSVLDGASSRTVMPTLRAMMAALRRYADDSGGALITSGSENAYVVKSGSGLTQLRSGISLIVRADRDNTAEATLNVDGLGPLPWTDAGGLRLLSGRILRGRFYHVILDADVEAWRVQAGASTLDEIPGFTTVVSQTRANAEAAGASQTAAEASRVVASQAASAAVPAAASAVAAQAATAQDRTSVSASKLLVDQARTDALTASSDAKAATAEVMNNIGRRLNFATIDGPNAATQATIPADVGLLYIGGKSVQGVGAGLYRRAKVQSAGPGKFKTLDNAFWELEDVTSASLEQLGAGLGNGGFDAAAIRAAAAISRVTRLGAALQPAGITDLASYMAATFKDDGSGKADLPGLYGKWAIPALARDAGMSHSGDLVAGLHCPVSSQCTSAVEVLVGDSIATYQANTLFRSNMLAAALEREIRAQAGNKPVVFYDRAIGGKTLNEFFSDTLKRPERPPWWLADVVGTRWIDLVKTLRPTRLWVSFGMNDSSLVSINDLKSLVAIVRGWDFPCDIVLLTNIVPRANVNASFPTWNTIAEQEGRHNAAGLVRTFARYMGLGLVDMNRQMLRAVHGYDPVESYLTKQGSYTAAGNGFAGDRQCTDYKVTFTIDTAQIPADNSTPLGFNTGPGTEDVFYLTRTTGANAYNLTCYTGNAGDNLAYVVNAPVTIVPDDGTKIRLCFERYGNFACLYKDGTAAEAYGEFLPHLWSGKIMARGGRYVPVISCSKANVVRSAGFDYGVPALCDPSLSVDDLFGDAFPAFYRGGSGWNHPGSLVDPHVYGPVLRACQMFAGDPFVRSLPSTMTVRGADGQVRRFVFDERGVTILDGSLTSYGEIRTAGGYRLDLTNPAPRMVPADGSVVILAGTVADSAYFNFGKDGTLEVANGRVKAQSATLTNTPTSASGLTSGQVWRDASAGNVLKIVP